MSRVKLADWIDDLGGKTGNAVFTKGRSGLNLRKRVVPTNPQSQFQTPTRTALKGWSESWKALLQADIAIWNSTAAAIKKSNRFGEKYSPTGHKLYVAYNVENSLYGNGVEQTLPPTIIVPSTVGVSAMDADGTLSIFTVTTDQAVPANTKLLVFVTPQLSAGVSNFKGKFAFIKSFPAATGAGPLNIKTEYEAHFGTLITGKKVSVQCYLTSATAPVVPVKFKTGTELAGKVK
jgi:hypothetical protein